MYREALVFVHPEGFEPPTLGSVDQCSIQLSYGCMLSPRLQGSRKLSRGPRGCKRMCRRDRVGNASANSRAIREQQHRHGQGVVPEVHRDRGAEPASAGVHVGEHQAEPDVNDEALKVAVEGGEQQG